MRPSTFFLPVLAAIACAATLTAADAPQYRGGANHSGAYSESLDLSAGGSALTLAFSMSTGTSQVLTDPLVVDGRIIVANMAGEVICLELSGGAPVWTRSMGSEIRATPAVDSGRVFVSTTGGVLSALSLDDGLVLWTVNHGGQTYAAPAVSGGKVVVAHGFGNNHITAYWAHSGAISWTRQMDRFSQSSPAIYGDKVVVASPNGLIQALSLADGSDLWPQPVETAGIFYGSAPCVVQDPDSTNIYVFANPGDDEYITGSTVTGYRGYVTYRVNLDTGEYSRILPGSATSHALTRRGLRNSTPEAPEQPNMWTGCPDELRKELSSLSHLDSMIEVIGMYESMYGLDLSRLKQGLRDHAARDAAWKAEEAAQIASGTRTAKAPKNAIPLPASSLSTTWPSSFQVKPAPAAYLARGTGRFLAVMMREIPSTTREPRAILFSLNPAMNGQVRWTYATDQLPSPATPQSPAAVLVPKATDPNGAYLMAPLGHSVGIFDAAGSNLPLTQIDMTAPVYAAPVVANGRVVVIDTAGFLKVFTGTNAAPSVPVVTAPAQNANLMTLPNPAAVWDAASDDSTPAGSLVYVIRYAIDAPFSTGYQEVTLAAGQTSYHWDGLAADSMVTFAVRAVDGQGAASAFSAPRSFSHQLDTTAPSAPGAPAVGQGALALAVSFAPSASPDVTNYRVTVTNTQTSDSFIVNLGTLTTVLINGALPSTPLVAGVTYSVSVVAQDRRGNTSAAASSTGIPLQASGVDLVPPAVVSAVLHDSNGNGAIETVTLTFSEAISFNPGDLNVSGFSLNGLVAVSNLPASEPNVLTLNFGAGVQGTGMMELTFDPVFGSVKDLAGHPLAAIGAGDLAETDLARPVMMLNTLSVNDTDGNGTPDRITVGFSEAMDPAFLNLADVALLADSAGTPLVATAIVLLPTGTALDITLNGLVGVMGVPSLAFADSGAGTFLRDLSGNIFAGEYFNLSPVITVTPAPGERELPPGFVRLDATQSTDPDAAGDAVLSFDWRLVGQPFGADATFRGTNDTVISGSGHGAVSLLAVTPGMYTVMLTVSDPLGGMANETLVITILNVAPIADAGPDFAVAASTGQFTLDGRRSADPNSHAGRNDIGLQSWIVISAPAGANPVFVNPTALETAVQTTGLPAGTYRFRLTVFDNANLSGTDDVTVRLHDGSNLPPAADAGPDRRVALGQAIRLDGRFSRDDSPLTHTWSQVSGPAVTIGNPNQARLTVVPLAAGVSVFRLTVSDGQFESTDEVVIDVVDPLAPGTMPQPAVTAPSSVKAGDDFTVDASAALAFPGVPSSAALLVNMVQVSGPTLHLLSGGTGPLRSFAATMPGMVELSVTLTDGQRTSAPARVRIHVRAANNAPTELMFNQLAANAGTGFTFDFSGSVDSDGDPFTVSVIQTGGPVAAELTSSDGLSFAFSPQLSGTYSFEAVAYDGVQFSAPYSFTVVHAPAGSGMPAAVPSLMSLSANGVAATLTASNVTDPDGDTVGFLWVQTAGPSAVIADEQSKTTAVDLIPGAASYAFDLFVDDGTHQTKAGTVTFSTNAGPGPAPGGEGGGGCAAIAGSGRVWMPLAAAALAMLGLLAIRRRRVTGA